MTIPERVMIMEDHKRQCTTDDLNMALFAQLYRLDGASLDEIDGEIARSEAVQKLAGRIIENANTSINLMRLKVQAGMDVAEAVGAMPRMLGGGQE